VGVAMAATISWKLALIALIPMPLIAILTNWYGNLLHRRFSLAQAAFSTLNDKVQESVTGVRVIKSFGHEKENIDDFRNQSADVVGKNIAVAKIDSLYDPTISIIVAVSYLLSIGFGAKFVVSGELTLGELVSFTSYLGLLVWPMLAFGWLFNILERGRASYGRILSLLSEKSDVQEKENALDIVPSGDIEYKVDSFAYPGEANPVLRDIYVYIKRGETVGIVGKTGAGKTTLLKLLLREFDVEDGNILFGGRPIKDYKLKRLREAIGYVPQDHVIFSATVKENIAFAAPDASEEKIREAAKAANIHDDIMGFPDGYETMAGERGVSLSGGQKQRISIARALLPDPEVLILDDALSAVDARTEEKILKVLREKRKNKTTIITSHRLSSLAHADQILVLEDGKIVEKGTHEALMKLGGIYKEMFLRQQLEEQVEQGG
ncbi:MAG: ATP-binding cassette domain-containing protein, partial [Bacillales bacterium]